jgi:hypothetical protein
MIKPEPKGRNSGPVPNASFQPEWKLADDFTATLEVALEVEGEGTPIVPETRS